MSQLFYLILLIKITENLILFYCVITYMNTRFLAI